MEKEGRRTGRGKGGGKLAADQAGFADAGHDHTPSARRQKPQRKDEGGFFRRPGVEPVPHGGEPGDFGIQNVLRELDERGGNVRIVSWENVLEAAWSAAVTREKEGEQEA